ncbi:MAG: DUF2784 family protein [Candidatus Scalindua sp.]
MLYELVVKLIILIHFFWVFFLIFGAFIGRYKTVARWLHISGLVFSIFIQVFSWDCPLTYIEVWLQSKYNPNHAYSDSFIDHYMDKVNIRISRDSVFIITLGIVVMSFLIYYKPLVKDIRRILKICIFR